MQVELTNNAPSGSNGRAGAEAAAGMDVDAGIDAVRVRARRARSRAISSRWRSRRSRTASTRSTRWRPPTAATYHEGYDVIEHRDLETRYLYHDATSRVRGVDVKIAPGLKVGYVMGVGDEVPAGIAQLGAQVQLLDRAGSGRGDLSQFDAIMTGTRAYAVRDDLRTYNQRLLDYVQERRQPDRPLQHAGRVRSEQVRAVSGAAAAQRRRSVGGGFAGRRFWRRRVPSSRRRTRSPRPTSTAGSSSAARSSSASGTRPTRR